MAEPTIKYNNWGILAAIDEWKVEIVTCTETEPRKKMSGQIHLCHVCNKHTKLIVVEVGGKTKSTGGDKQVRVRPWWVGIRISNDKREKKRKKKALGEGTH